MLNRKKLIIVISTVLLFVFLTACGGSTGQSANEGELREVTMMLDWYPNTNHTGLYVAKHLGYYEEEGLDVEIVQPGEGSTADQLVASGQAQFGISYQESVTEARAREIPLVSIAAVIQHNTSAFASLKEDNITTVHDFEGKRYGGWGSPVEEAVIKAVMEAEGADYSTVEHVMLGTSDFFQSVGRMSDFQWIYYGWDGVEAERRGMEINVIMLKDLDPALDYYTPVISTSEALIEEDPELVSRFMAATTKGYMYAIENPQHAAEILIEAVPDLNAELVEHSQRWLADKYQDDAPQWGYQEREVWQRYAEWLYERDLIPNMIDVDRAFTNDFLVTP